MKQEKSVIIKSINPYNGLIQNGIRVNTFVPDGIEIEYTDSHGHKNKTRQVKKHRKDTIFNSVSLPFTSDSPTDFFIGYCEHIAPLMVYTCLKTIYTNSGRKFILDMMFQVWQFRPFDLETIESYENMVSLDEKFIDRLSFGDKFTKDKEGNIKLRKSNIMKELEYAEKRIKHIQKLHTYKIVTGIDGKKHRQEIIPYYTQEKTRYGKVVDENINLGFGLDVEDLLQECKKAIFELFSLGLVNNVNDIWYYSDYCYKTVNNYIMKRRSIQYQENKSLYTVNKEGETLVIQEGTFDKGIKKVESDSLLSGIWSIIEKSLDKRANAKNIKFTYFAMLEGITEEQIAKSLNVSHQAVNKYKKQIRQIIFNYRELSVYDLLNETINEIF